MKVFEMYKALCEYTGRLPDPEWRIVSIERDGDIISLIPGKPGTGCGGYTIPPQINVSIDTSELKEFVNSAVREALHNV